MKSDSVFSILLIIRTLMERGFRLSTCIKVFGLEVLLFKISFGIDDISKSC